MSSQRANPNFAILKIFAPIQIKCTTLLHVHRVDNSFLSLKWLFGRFPIHPPKWKLFINYRPWPPLSRYHVWVKAQNFCGPLLYAEGTAVPTNQSLFTWTQHWNSHQGVKILRQRGFERGITLLFLFEINRTPDHLSTLLSVAVSKKIFPLPVLSNSHSSNHTYNMSTYLCYTWFLQ